MNCYLTVLYLACSLAQLLPAPRLRLVRMLNDLREIRDFFSIEARANNASSQIPGESTIFIDYLALEFDYTLPEFPLQMDLRIE